MPSARSRAAIAALLSINVMLALACVAPPVATAGGSNQVQGYQSNGGAVVGNPVLMGGSDGVNVRTFATDTSGRPNMVGAETAGSAVVGLGFRVMGSDGTLARDLATDTSGRPIVVGPAPAGSAVVGAPVLQGGKDGAGNAQAKRTDVNGVTLMSPGLNWLVDPVTRVAPTSSATSFTTIGPSALASQKVFIGWLFFYNTSTTADHTVTVQSSGGASFGEFTLAKGATARSGGNAILCGSDGSLQTASGESVQWKIDSAAGAATDVTASGVFVQKALN